MAQGLLLAACLTLVAGCVVDPVSVGDPGQNTQGPTSPTPTAAAAAFEPTADVVAPTPQIQETVEPTPTAPPEPTATTAPEPTATPIPDREQLQSIEPVPDVLPSPVQAGSIGIPVGQISFVLGEQRPVLQLPGHTLIYVDDDRLAEVDIFTPVAAADGSTLDSYQDVIDHITTNPSMSPLQELDAITIAGVPTRVFQGLPVTGVRVYHTDLEQLENESAGWLPPTRVRMWVIDNPGEPIVLSAESLEDPGQFSDAVRLATEILTTITFG